MADWEVITLLLCFCLLFVGLVGLMEVLSKRYLPRDPFGNSNLVAAGGVVVALVLSGFTTALVKKEFFGGREAQVFEKGYAPLVEALFNEDGGLVPADELKSLPLPQGAGVVTLHNHWGREGWEVAADRMVRMPESCRVAPGSLPSILVLIRSTQVHTATIVDVEAGKKYSYTYDFRVMDLESGRAVEQRAAKLTSSLDIPHSLYKEVEDLACCLASSKQSEDPGSWNNCWDLSSLLSEDS